jgi:excisionase family DNA binding protein
MTTTEGAPVEQAEEKTWLTVTEAANVLGIHPKTLRRWETQGLIAPVARTPSGQRRYRPDEVARLIRPRQ